METKHFSFGNIENNRLVNFVRILFGAVCIAIAVFWVIFNINSDANPGSVWLTILFLSGFGFYQIWAGAGKAERYIEIGKNAVVLKKYIFLKPECIEAAETEKIAFFPLKILFIKKTGRKILLRLGTTYYESNDKITDELGRYADENRITTEVIQEEV